MWAWQIIQPLFIHPDGWFSRSPICKMVMILKDLLARVPWESDDTIPSEQGMAQMKTSCHSSSYIPSQAHTLSHQSKSLVAVSVDDKESTPFFPLLDLLAGINCMAIPWCWRTKALCTVDTYKHLRSSRRRSPSYEKHKSTCILSISIAVVFGSD